MKNDEVLNIHNQVTVSDIEKIINRQLDEIENDREATKRLPPCLIWGSPGIGKSTIVKNICEKRGFKFHDIRALTMDPCDIRGLPVPNKENKSMDWFVNGLWPRDPEEKGIIFLDEISACGRDIQGALFQLVLDRNLGDLYKVPDRVLIIAAGNKMTDKACAQPLVSALANRFMHFELKSDSEQWISWGLTHNIHPSVMGYVRYKPANLFVMEGQTLDRGWPSPRSWERVSQMLYLFDDENVVRKIVYGLIGNGVGADFMEFHKNNKQYEDILKYMLNPDLKLEAPTKMSDKYAIVSALNYHLWRGNDENDEDKRINGFFRICELLTSEFATVAVQSAMMGNDKKNSTYACEKLFKCPMYKDFIKKHGRSIKKHVTIDID